jgi:hypothetical protein
MIDVNTKFDDQITPGIERLQRRLLREYPVDAVEEYKKLTPRRGGNARRNTRLGGTTRIELNYPYGEVLDQGRQRQGNKTTGSRQAPQGMTRPFIKWISQWLNRNFRI